MVTISISVTEIIGLILIFFVLPMCIILYFVLEYISEKRTFELFKPGMRIEYYCSNNHHGKFEKFELLSEYDIIDRDGKYVLIKNIKRENSEPIETNLKIDCKYCPKMILKNKEGNIVKTFKFE